MSVVYYQDKGEIKTKHIDNILLEKLPENIIKIESPKHIKDYLHIPFLHTNSVVELFKELDLILATKISFDEAIKLMIESNTHNTKNTEILICIYRALENVQPLNQSLKSHMNYLGKLPIIFLHNGVENGNIEQNVHSLYTVISKIQKAKNDFLSALIYPVILSITLFFSIFFIMDFVLPKFESIFMQYGDNLPLATKSLLYIKEILYNDFAYIILVMLCISIYALYLYKKYKINFHKIFLLKIPIISNLYKQFVLYKLFLSLETFVKAGYTFQEALESTKLLIVNEYLLKVINNILNKIQNGKDIASAFQSSEIFDSLSIRLLYIALKSNDISTQLGSIMQLHEKKLDMNIKIFSSLIGPIYIAFISMFILWLVFALMLPIWNLNSVLN